MKLAASLLSSIALSGCVGLAGAGSRVDLSIIDRSTGESLEIYRHRGRLYVAGTPGNRYAVSVRNKSGSRILTVVSVDGINAITGQTAALSQSGYVLSPWQDTEVSGWRKSMDDVAAFYFTRLEDSYAARTLRPAHAGVIGVAVFAEAPASRPPAFPAMSAEPDRASASSHRAAQHESAPANRDARGGQQLDPFGASAAASAKDQALAKPAESRLGTGHGERIDAPSRYTDFKRAGNSPVEVITVYYDSHANLIAQGVIGVPRQFASPQPFPGGFAPDPKY